MKTIITEVMKTSWFSRDSAGGPLNLENVGFQGMRGLPKLNRNNTSLFDLYHMRKRAPRYIVFIGIAIGYIGDVGCIA